MYCIVYNITTYINQYLKYAQGESKHEHIRYKSNKYVKHNIAQYKDQYLSYQFRYYTHRYHKYKLFPQTYNRTEFRSSPNLLGLESTSYMDHGTIAWLAYDGRNAEIVHLLASEKQCISQ
jgi:hypothetical protein